MQALRGALVRRLRVPVTASSLRPTLLGSSWLRNFSEEAHARSTYLDRGQVTDRILNVVKTFQKVDPSKVTPTSNFQKDLGLDSLDTVEIVMAFEEEFALEIPDSDADNITSVGEAIDYIASHPRAK